MNTDIARLHDVLEGRLNGRRCGKTTAVCHLIAGEVECGDVPRIDVLLSYLNDGDHFWRVLQEVFCEHEITANASRHGGYVRVWHPRSIHIAFRFEGFQETLLRTSDAPLFDARRHSYPRVLPALYSQNPESGENR